MMGLLTYLIFFATISLIFAIATIGLSLQWGQCGQFNAGVVGFIAIGAYTQAIVSIPSTPGIVSGLALPFPIALVASMLVTAALATVIGLATIRLRSDYLALATFGIAATIQLLILNLAPLTGGGRGITGVPQPFSQAGPSALAVIYLVIVIAITAISFLAIERMLVSPWGRTLRAIRDNEVAVNSLGKRVETYRLSAFVIGCTMMGLAGALYASFIGYVSPFDFVPIMTFQVWAMLIVGGSYRTLGAIIGSFVVWALWSLSGMAVVSFLPTRFQTQGGAVQAIIIGVALIAVLIWKPVGIFGASSQFVRPARTDSKAKKGQAI